MSSGNGIDVEAADFTGDGFLDLYLTGFQRTDYLYRGVVEPASTPASGALDLRTDLDLHAAFPNPFRTSTRVAFTLRDAQRIDLAIYDSAGSLVERLASEYFEPGRYDFDWDPNADLPTGAYFLRLRHRHGHEARTLTRIR